MQFGRIFVVTFFNNKNKQQTILCQKIKNITKIQTNKR